MQATDQYVSASGGFYDRGSIFFKDKDGREVSAATIKTGYLLALKPVELKEPQRAYEVLSPFIEIDRDTFFARALKEEIHTKRLHIIYLKLMQQRYELLNSTAFF